MVWGCNSAAGDLNLKNIRKKNKGRRFNRKLNTFPYYRLSNFIECKASWEGIAVIEVNEYIQFMLPLWFSRFEIQWEVCLGECRVELS